MKERDPHEAEEIEIEPVSPEEFEQWVADVQDNNDLLRAALDMAKCYIESTPVDSVKHAVVRDALLDTINKALNEPVLKEG